MEVMTGAVLPKNCDTVIPFEHIIEKDGCYCVCKNIQTKLGQNIHRCGSDYPKGEVLLNEGYVINAPAVAVLASEGVEKVLVKKNPRFAIITTGSELVPITSMPEPHQIRMSNVYTALPCLSHFGIDQIDRYHLEDDKQTMKIKMSELLKNYDVLILSGGVSKGKKDHVPDVLNELGVEKVFHRIAQKPGKPMFFGTLQSKCVFALPGNPVSMLVCMSRYIIPWLKKNLGILSDKQECVALNNGIKPKEKLVLFSPVKVNIDEFGVRKADTIKVNGSGDFNSLTESDGFVEVPKGNSEVSSGTLLHYYPWS
jgi:molybdopterin molybdotransferase